MPKRAAASWYALCAARGPSTSPSMAAKPGIPFSQPDLIIAATGLQHGLTVVTRDSGDYGQAHLPLLNPWLHGWQFCPLGDLYRGLVKNCGSLRAFLQNKVNNPPIRFCRSATQSSYDLRASDFMDLLLAPPVRIFTNTFGK